MNKKAYIVLNNGKIVYRDVNCYEDKPIFVSINKALFYKFAFTYDDMIRKLVKNKKQKERLKEIKEDYINFIENPPKVGDKIYYHEKNKNKILKHEFIFDGDVYQNDNFEFIFIDDILNLDITFN